MPPVKPFVPTYRMYLDPADPFTRSLGLFVARWSFVEMVLLLPFAAATRVTQEIAAGVLASTNSTEGKIKIVKVAVVQSELGKPEKKKILFALRRLEKICETRNIISHHLWVTRDDGTVATIDYRKTEDDPSRFRYWQQADLDRLRDELLDVAREISEASGSSFVTERVVEAIRRLEAERS